MTTPGSLGNTVLALSPPRVPEATTPVVGAHYGVPKHVYDLKPMGLKVGIDPPLSGTVVPGDVITLILNQQPVATKSINPGNENAENTLYIPKDRLLTNRLNELVYTITRGSQNIGTSTPILTLLYNAIRPGMEDRTPGDGAHSELQLILPQDVIDDGIDAARAKQGVHVCFSYPYCRADDNIWLNCNGQDVYRKVTVAEAPAIPSAQPTTVCVMVDETVFQRAGFSPTFVFSYTVTVTDDLGNGPDTDSPWSAAQIVDVDLTGSRLPKLIMREIQNDPTDDPGTIDLEKLGKNPLKLIALTIDPRFAPGDTLVATYTAKVTGQPDVVVTLHGTVEADEFGQKKPCVLEVDNGQVIANSVVTGAYQLLRNGNVQGSSRVAAARVIGVGLPDLEAPRLQKSVNGELDPLDVANLQGANGQVEVLGYRKGDTVQLIVEGAPDAGTPTFDAKPLNTNSRANFALTKAFIAANMGKKVLLSYLLNRDGKPPLSSPILTASIGTIPDSDPRLPSPTIGNVQGDELDVTQLRPDALFHVSEWPHQVEGQNGWSKLTGFDANGVATSYEFLKGEPLNAPPGLSVRAPTQWLKTLVCCSRNIFSNFSPTLQVSFLPRRVSGERTGHCA